MVEVAAFAATAAGEDRVNASCNEIPGKGRQAIVMALCPPIFDGGVSALDVARLLQPLAKSFELRRETRRRSAAEKTNRWPRLPSQRGNRRNSHRA
jgi:hypothetical protein